MKSFDLVIVGGGLAGQLLALSLRHLPLRIALIEKHGPMFTKDPASLDRRALALSYGSSLMLNDWELWQEIACEATPVHSIHVSQQGHFGSVRIKAEEERLPALGYILPFKNLQAYFSNQLQHSSINLYYHNEVTAILDHTEQVILELTTGEPLKSQLTIAADGVHSSLRRLLNLTFSSHDYEQTAIVGNVSLDRSHHHQAYERFTREGPLALLPIGDNQMTYVWVVSTSTAERLLSCPEDIFLASLQATFGFRAGLFQKIGQRTHYPLTQVKGPTFMQRIGFLGSSAHHIHPIAGQGFNLTIRDIAALRTLFHSHPLDADLFTQYIKQRKADTRFIEFFTHQTVKLFGSQKRHSALLRSFLLIELERFHFFKKLLNDKLIGL